MRLNSSLLRSLRSNPELPRLSDYHNIRQPYRIQKRLALNQCFKAIQQREGIIDPLVYVTFGGQDLYDIMDLLAVFDVTKTRLRIVSYEQDRTIADRARECPVVETLSKVKSVDLRIVFAGFPDGVELLHQFRSNSPFIYFLDYIGTFRRRDAETIHDLLASDLIRRGDYLLITSCLSPRIVKQQNFMAPYQSTFEHFFRQRDLDAPFMIRNHVDLLLALALSQFERTSARAGHRQRVIGNLLRKFKYADSHVPMGLWLYHLESSTSHQAIADRAFDEFPHAFSAVRRKEVPNIFD